MRVEWRKPRTTGLPLGTVFGLVLAVAGVAAALWLRAGLPVLACQFREWTGVPCPTCGSTRLGQALLHGDIGEALSLNPLVFLVLSGVSVWAAASTAARLLHRPTPRLQLDPRERLLLRIAAVATLAAGWVYLIVRGV